MKDLKQKFKNAGTTLTLAVAPCMVKTYKQLTMEKAVTGTIQSLKDTKYKIDMKRKARLEKKLQRLQKKELVEQQEEDSEEVTFIQLDEYDYQAEDLHRQ